MKLTTKHSNIRKIPCGSQFSCLIYAESSELAVYIILGESYRLAVSYNCGTKPLFDESSSPESSEFSAPCSSTDLVPMHFGHSPHPQKHLCTDSCRLHIWHRPQATICTLHLSSQSVAVFLHWRLLPLPSDSWCRASTKERIQGMDIPFVLAPKPPISNEFMTD